MAASNTYKQSTAVLVKTLQLLKTKDFTKMMGSGINVQLTNLEGQLIGDEFCIAAEDMEEVKQPIIQSLYDTLKRRKVMLASEIRSIENEIE